MRFQKPLALLLAFLLAGCALQQPSQKPVPTAPSASFQGPTNLVPAQSATPSNGSTLAEEAFNPENSLNATHSNGFSQPSPPANASLVAYYFWSRACPYCVNTNSFITALEKNSSGLAVIQVDLLMNLSAYRLYSSFADEYQIPNASRVVPVIFINNSFLADNYTIKEKLPALVSACLKSGNCSNASISGEAP